jgi:hypothetical protein
MSVPQSGIGLNGTGPIETQSERRHFRESLLISALFRLSLHWPPGIEDSMRIPGAFLVVAFYLRLAPAQDSKVMGEVKLEGKTKIDREFVGPVNKIDIHQTVSSSPGVELFTLSCLADVS